MPPFPRAALLALIAALTLAAPAAASDQVVVLEEGTGAAPAQTTEQLEQEVGFEAEQRYDHVIDGFTADLTQAQVAELEAQPEVAAVVPDRPVRIAAAQPAVAWGSVPPGVRRVTGATAASGQVRDAASGAVAVVDTGVDLDHPDLNVVGGYDCVDGDTVPEDGHGHGTHVAGVIGARNNAFGVTGVAPGTRIVAIRVLDSRGEGSLSTVVCGLEKVRELAPAYGISVVNLSLGGGATDSTCTNDPEHRALCRLAAAGIVPVVAAGNESADIGALPTGYDRLCPGYLSTCRSAPAVYPEVLTVAAMTETDGLPGALGSSCAGMRDGSAATGYSNFATRAEDAAHLVAAPGTCVRSTYLRGAYASMSGTSMATPHVAGLVALCEGEGGAAGPCAGLSTPQVIERMRLTADGAGYTGVSGRDYGPLARYSEAPVQLTAGGSPQEELVVSPPAATPTGGGTAAPAPTQGPAPSPAPAPSAPPAPATPVSGAQPSRGGAEPTVRLSAFRTSLATLRRSGLRVRVRGTAVRGTLRLTVSRTVARKLHLRSTTLASVRVTEAGTVRLRLTKPAAKALRRTRAALTAQLTLAGTTTRIAFRR